MILTHHALERQRVNPRASLDDARTALFSHQRVIDQAAAFGCRVIKLDCKAKLILVGERVVTVITCDRPWSGHSFSRGAN